MIKVRVPDKKFYILYSKYDVYLWEIVLLFKGENAHHGNAQEIQNSFIHSNNILTHFKENHS